MNEQDVKEAKQPARETEEYTQDAVGDETAKSASDKAPNASDGHEAIDISTQWRDGAVRIDSAGSYFLSSDVETSGALYVAAPANETVTLDLQGHSVKVQGAESSAVNLDESLGTVVILDSTYKEGEPKSRIELQANKASSAVCGVQANFVKREGAESGYVPRVVIQDVGIESHLNTLDAKSSAETFDAYGLYFGYADPEDSRDRIDVEIKNVRIYAGVHDGIELTAEQEADLVESGEVLVPTSKAGLACAVFANARGATIGGAFAARLESTGGVADLYSPMEDAFALARDFDPSASVRVFAAGNEAGTVVAHAQSNELADAFQAKLLDATVNGLVVKADGEKLLLVRNGADGDTGAATSDAPAAGSADAAGAPAPESPEASGEPADEPSGLELKEEAAQGSLAETLGTASPLKSSTTPLGSSLRALALTAQSDGDLDSEENMIELNREDLSEQYALAPGKTYYLSGDLTVKSNLVIDGKAANGTARLDLRGHKLTMLSPTSESTSQNSIPSIRIGDTTAQNSYHHSLEIVSTGSLGSIEFIDCGNLVVKNTGSLKLDNVDVSKSYTRNNELNGFSTPVIGIDSASTFTAVDKRLVEVELSNSSISIDLSAQTNAPSSLAKTSVYAVKFDTLALKAAKLENCEISAVAPGSGGFSDKSGMHYNDAYAVYVGAGLSAWATASNIAEDAYKGSGQVQIDSCTLSAVSPEGCAYGVYQPYIDPVKETRKRYPATHSQKINFVGGQTSISVSGALGERGVAGNKATTPITLNAPIAFAAEGNAPHSAAFESDGTQGAFVIGAGFSGASLPVYMGTSDEDANKSGSVAALWAEGLGDEAKAAAAASLVSAVDLPVKVAVGDTGAVFEVDKANAGAYIEKANGSEGGYFSTANAAVAELENGDTVKLLKDAGAVTFAPPASEQSASDKSSLSYAVDLNGHQISSFACSSAANVKLENTGEAKTLRGSTFALSGSNRYTAAIVQSGAGTLCVKGIPVAVQGSTTRSSRGASASAGTLVLEGCAISVTANVNDAYGVYAEGAAAVESKGGTTIEAVQYGTARVAYGVGQASGATGGVNVSGQSVTARGIGQLHGIHMASGALTVSNASVTAAAEDGIEGKEAYAVYAPASAVTLDAASLAVTFEEGLEPYENTGDVLLGSGAALSLKGSCSFSSPVGPHVQQLAQGIVLDPSFSLPQGSSLSVSCAQALLDDKLAALPDGADESAVIADAALFATAGGSYYEGWELEKADNERWLYYHTDAAAQVGDVSYNTLAAAVNAVPAEGGTVKVLRDDLRSPALAISGKSVTLDLNGHDVAIAGAGTAMQIINGASLTVIDSTNGKKTLSLSASQYGFEARGTSALTLEGCAVKVSSAENGDLVGIMPESGPVALKGAELSVEKSDAALTGSVVGIQVPAKSGDGGNALSIDGSSSVVVANSGGFSSAGRIVNRMQQGSSDSNYFYSGATVMRIDLDEDSDLYKEITAEFRKNAKFDGYNSWNGLPTGSSVYSAQIYYTAPMELADGTAVWAFSNPVTEEGTIVVNSDGNEELRDVAGRVETVYPAAIYVQSTYQNPPDAVGLWAREMTMASTATADVSVSGKVAATSARGNAYAVRSDQGNGSWTFDGADVSAATNGTSSYKRNAGEPANLTDVLGLNSVLGVVFYPKYDSNPTPPNEVRDQAPQAAAIKMCDPSKNDEEGQNGLVVKLSGTSAIKSSSPSDDGLSAVGILADQVVVTDSFSLAEGSAPVSIASADGKAVAAPEKFAVGEGDYNVTDAQRALFADATGAHSPAVDGDGDLVWNDGQFSVRFLDAYGEVVKVEEGVMDGQAVQLPGYESMARDATPAVTYLFKGWSTRANAKPGDDGVLDVEDGNVAFLTFAAPEGADTNTVTYYPVYKELANTVSVSFRVAFDSNGTKLKTVSADLPLGTTISEAIGNGSLTLPARASYTTGEGDDAVRQAFVGWRGTVNGTMATYDEEELRDTPLYRDAVLTAHYVAVGPDQYLARFKVGAALYAYAAQKGTAPSWTTASGSDALPAKASESGTNYVFRGWAGRYAKDSAEGWKYDERTDIPSSQALPKSDSDVTYTARFSAEVTSVSLNFMYWGKQEGGYAWNPEPIAIVCDYGANPYHLLDDKMDTQFVKDGQVYKFVGWTTRYNDKEPMWGEGGTVGPAEDMAAVTRTSGGVTQSTKFWAVYKVEEQKADVVFMTKGEDGSYAEYASASAVPAKATIAEAFAATQASAPAGLTEDAVFRGWSNVQNAKNGISETVSSANIGRYIDASTGKVVLYAAYGSPDTYKVVLYDNDGVEDDKPYYETFAYKGGLVELGGTFEKPNKAGMYLDGWNSSADGSGASFDLRRDVPSGDIGLYAQYKPIAVDAAEGSSADVSGAFVNASAAEGSTGVVLELAKTDAASAALKGSLSSYDTLAASYNLRLGFVGEDLPTYVTSGFGTVKVALPVPDACAGRDVVVRWVDEGGSVRSATFAAGDLSTQAGDSEAKTVEVSISSYALEATGGNIAMISRLTAEEQKLAVNKAQALEALQEAYDSYNEDDYVGFDTTVQAEYEKGVKAVNDASTPQSAVDAANSAIAAMAAVPTKRGLETEKATALKRLADAYAGYSKENYDDEGWKALGEAYEDARKAINSAETGSGATNAANSGITAMAAVKTASDGTSASGGADGTSSAGTNGSGVPSTSTAATSTGRTIGSTSSESGVSSVGGGLPSASASGGVPSVSGSGSGSAAGDPQAMLGASLTPVTNDLMNAKELAADVGLYVESVDDGGPASAAGVKEGDVITKIDGAYVQSLDDLKNALKGKQAGDQVVLTIDRNGDVADYTVTLGEGGGAEGALGIGGVPAVGTSNGAGGADSEGGAFGESASPADGAGQVASDAPWAVAVGIAVAAAAMAAVVWWLMRRRNAGLEAADDDGADDGGAGDIQAAGMPAIRI